MTKGYSILIKLFFLSILLFIATFAWFNSEQQINVQPLETKVSEISRVSISLDNGTTWESETNILINSDFIFKNEITGDGINLYKASMKSDVGQPYGLVSAIKNEDYIEKEILVKSNVDTYVFLDSNSTITPKAGTKIEELIGENVVRKSNEGNFTKDLVAASVRVAFIKNAYDEETKNYNIDDRSSLVWAPNKQYKITKINNQSYSADINSNDEQQYTYMYKNENNLQQVAYLSNVRDTLNASSKTNDANGDPWILYLEPDAIEKITIRIWIEGQDRDCLKAIRGGEFNTYFSFIGINKLINNNIPDVAISGNTISNYDNTMQYSINYGNTWIDYSEENNPEFTTGSVVFVRYKETIDTFASEYAVLKY